MKLQLVTFEQAKQLSNIGFDWEYDTIWMQVEDEESVKCPARSNVMSSFISTYLCPTVALALEWLRKERNIICAVAHYDENYIGEYYFRGLWDYTDSSKIYTEAESTLLSEILNNLNNEKGNL